MAMTRLIVVAVVGVGVLASLVGLITVFGIARPIRRAVQATERLAAGDLAIVSTPRSGDDGRGAGDTA